MIGRASPSSGQERERNSESVCVCERESVYVCCAMCAMCVVEVCLLACSVLVVRSIVYVCLSV